MPALVQKADHANVVGTQKGFRATVVDKQDCVLASLHFNVKSFNRLSAVDDAYAEMKKWLAGWGVA